MAAPATPVLEHLNPLDLANRMGVDVKTLALAMGADPEILIQNPRNTGHDEQLQTVSDLWKNLTILVGDEKHARLFLGYSRPELDNETPLQLLEAGKPGVVLDLVLAMREMLP
jgi:hypothetical protein